MKFGVRHRWASGIAPIALIVLAGLAAAQGGGPSVEVATFAATDGAHPGTSLRVAVAVTLDAGWHVNAHEPLDPFLIPTVLEVESFEGITVEGVVYPGPETLTTAFSAEPLAVYGGTFHIGLTLALAPDLAAGDHTVQTTLTYQACDDTQCFAPAKKPITIPITVRPPGEPLAFQHEDLFASIAFDAAPTTGPSPIERTPAATPPSVVADDDWQARAARFTMARTTFGYQPAAAFLAFLSGEGPGAASPGASPWAGASFWVVLVGVLAGGLLLNLTPCVLPLIPINLGIIGAGAQAGSRARGFALGGLYGLGIASVYGGLGLVVILGLSSTFGALNATPVFNGAIAVVFIVLGLAMFDVLIIDFSRFQARLGIHKAAGGRFVLAFFMGAVSALLAGACVAPVVISTIVYAQDQFAQGVTAALLLPFLLGVGMALPWPFAGAGLSFLPKPGIWMVRVKHAFGLFIFAMAIYYGGLAVTLSLGDRGAADQAPQTTQDGAWTPSLARGLAEAERDGKHVFVDFWATWCKNCTTMDKTTFKNPTVQAALEDFVTVKFQAENPDAPATRAVLDYFDVLGLPTYVILEPKPAP